jgi:hypothetical protein
MSMHADSYGTGNCHLMLFHYNVCFHSVMVSFVKRLKCITQMVRERHSLVPEFSNDILPTLNISCSFFHIFICLQYCVFHPVIIFDSINHHKSETSCLVLKHTQILKLKQDTNWGIISKPKSNNNDGDHINELYLHLFIWANCLPLTPLDAQFFRNKLEAPREGCLYYGK